jgi:hypothetical protein
MNNSLRLATLLSVIAAATVGAQTSGPPPAPEPRMESTFYVPLYGATAGISIPAGKLSEEHSAGYGVGAMIEYAVRGQAYSLRGEFMAQHFPTKSGHVVDATNLLSLGSTIIYRLNAEPAQAREREQAGAFVSGGIAVYNATHEGVRPGFNLGTGVEIPLTGFSAVAEARGHFVLTDARAMLAIPLTISVRF